MGRGKHLTEDEKQNIINLANDENLDPQAIATRLGKSLKSICKLLATSKTSKDNNSNDTTEDIVKTNYVLIPKKLESRGRKRCLSPKTIKERLAHYIETVISASNDIVKQTDIVLSNCTTVILAADKVKRDYTFQKSKKSQQDILFSQSTIVVPFNRIISHLIDNDRDDSSPEIKSHNILGSSKINRPTNDNADIKYNFIDYSELYEGQMDSSNFSYNGLGELNAFSPILGIDCYRGEFVNGKKHGLGIIINRIDSYVYKGQWRNNEYVGLGKVQNTNFNTYKGQFDNSRFHGLGYFEFLVDGRIFNSNKIKTFLGEFNDNARASDKVTRAGDHNFGIGLMTYYKEGESGQIVDHSYEGEWDKGEWNGVGTLKDFGRKKGGYYIYEGEFRKGKYDRKKSVFIKN